MLAVTSSHVEGNGVWLKLPGCHATRLLRLLTHSLARSIPHSLSPWVFIQKLLKSFFFTLYTVERLHRPQMPPLPNAVVIIIILLFIGKELSMLHTWQHRQGERIEIAIYIYIYIFTSYIEIKAQNDAISFLSPWINKGAAAAEGKGEKKQEAGLSCNII